MVAASTAVVLEWASGTADGCGLVLVGATAAGLSEAAVCSCNRFWAGSEMLRPMCSGGLDRLLLPLRGDSAMSERAGDLLGTARPLCSNANVKGGGSESALVRRSLRRWASAEAEMFHAPEAAAVVALTTEDWETRDGEAYIRSVAVEDSESRGC